MVSIGTIFWLPVIETHRACSRSVGDISVVT